MLRYTQKSSTQAQVFCHFPFIYFTSFHYKSKKIRTQITIYYYTVAAAFHFCKRARIILANEK